MGVDMKVKAIYDSEIGNITRSEKNWKPQSVSSSPNAWNSQNGISAMRKNS